MIPANIDKTECLRILNGLPDNDQEKAHSMADAAVLSYLRHLGEHEVADALEHAEGRCGGWWCA